MNITYGQIYILPIYLNRILLFVCKSRLKIPAVIIAPASPIVTLLSMRPTVSSINSKLLSLCMRKYFGTQCSHQPWRNHSHTRTTRAHAKTRPPPSPASRIPPRKRRRKRRLTMRRRRSTRAAHDPTSRSSRSTTCYIALSATRSDADGVLRKRLCAGTARRVCSRYPARLCVQMEIDAHGAATIARNAPVS